MKSTPTTLALHVEKELVLRFKRHQPRKNHPAAREAVFTCCDARSNETTPFRKM